jgi:predicted RNase H-related nuclease YkuK (DUF458 family)
MISPWKTGKKEIISIEKIYDILSTVIRSKDHKVIIGTDSVKLENVFVFTKAICILNEAFYDRRYFYIKQKTSDEKYSDLSKRLLKETSDSINLALLLKEKFSNINIEIHADVNNDPKHMSSRYKNMIAGYINGCGFDVKTKPESFVASSIADLHTRKS